MKQNSRAVDTPVLARRRRVRRVAVGAVLAIAATSLATTAGITAAVAAAGDPFDPAKPTVYVAQDEPTTLYTAVQDSSGVTFVKQGTASIAYNAIGYDTVDNYVYGIQRNNGKTNYLVRVGQNGAATSLGVITGLPTTSDAYNQATFGAGDTANILYVRDSTASNKLYAVDVTTRKATTITMSQKVPNISDIVYVDGFLWGVNTDGVIYRIDPVTGTVSSWNTGLGLVGPFGAQWVYGNGNLGLSKNDTGRVYQVAIQNGASATPSFTLVSSSRGPASSNNDGASSPGLDVDLGIVKTGPASYVPGSTLTYTLTVTNHGPGASSGFVVTDQVPAELTGVATTTDGCTVTGNALQCVLGALASGDSTTISVSGVSGSALTPIVNTTRVLGNEKDPSSGNNTSTSTSTPDYRPSVGLVKSASPSDVASFVVGKAITYSFQVTNTGNVPLTAIAVDDSTFTGTGTLSAITCPATTLAPLASTTCTADYVLTQADIDAGKVTNTAVASGTPPIGDPVDSKPSQVTLSADPQPSLSLLKTASAATPGTAGSTVTYTFAVTNNGTVSVTDLGIREDSFSGTGKLSAVTCEASRLQPGEATTCTADYTLTQADVDAGKLTNTAVATGTPPTGGPIDSPPSTATVTSPAAPSIAVEKSADVKTVSKAGDTIVYSFLVTNTGNTTLHDVAVAEGEFTGAGQLSAVTCPDTALAPADSFTCTATYEVQKADLDAGSIANTATDTALTPKDETVTSPPSKAEVEVLQPDPVVPTPTPTPTSTSLGGDPVVDPATPAPHPGASDALAQTGGDAALVLLPLMVGLIAVGAVLFLRRRRSA